MEEAGEYQKLALRRYPARAIRETAEGKYWGRFQKPEVAKQVSRSGGGGVWGGMKPV